MLGIKFYKSDFEAEETQRAYAECAKWCNETQKATIVECEEYYECVAIPEPLPPTVEDRIELLKAQLSSTDYKCLKYVDGVISEEEYSLIRAERAELRKQINELEEQL